MSNLFEKPRGRDFNRVHFSSRTDEWATPQEFFDALNDEFELLWDVCASHTNAKLPFYWTREDDGLKASWLGKRIWMNPPYGREIPKWVAKAATGGAELCVCLLPAPIRAGSTSTSSTIHALRCGS